MNATATEKLQFRNVDIHSIPILRKYLSMATSRTCDYTLAGIYMWAGYFHYKYAIAADTLFIKGVAENNLQLPAFSLPIGRLPLNESIRILREYCYERNKTLTLSAVPADIIQPLYEIGNITTQELTDWADYLYNAADLATLKDKPYNKKRNHINRFCSDNPGWQMEVITQRNIQEITDFYKTYGQPAVDSCYVTAVVEHDQTMRVLQNYFSLGFEGVALRTPSHGIVAFAIGEYCLDTLFVHIEKMRHDVSGAGETINKLFAEHMLKLHDITFINREEDVGDPGLRAAKMSYHPCSILKKYNVTFI